MVTYRTHDFIIFGEMSGKLLKKNYFQKTQTKHVNQTSEI